MTGLEKIVQKIESDAAAQAASRLDSARAEAQSIVSRGMQEAEALYEARVKKARQDADFELEKAKSGADLLVKKEALAARSEVINRLIDEAQSSLDALPAEVYFAALGKLLDKYAEPGKSGQLLLGERDFGRMPADFLAGRDGLDAVCDGRIKNGFVLRYGGIEQNCTFDALFDCDRDRLKDLLSRLIFG